LAVEEGRNQQQIVIADLRETIKTLAAENDRLDGTAIAAQSRIAELEQALAQAEAEFKHAKSQQERHLSEIQTAMLRDNAQAAEALQSLAKVQAARTVEVSALQNDLNKAVSRAHELELKLVRAQALLEAKGKKTEKG
jgi:predicted RNase H-like nuclease (RuvC/YqgF family)